MNKNNSRYPCIVTRMHNKGKDECKIIYHEVISPMNFGYELAHALKLPTSVCGLELLLEKWLGPLYHMELNPDFNIANIRAVLDYLEKMLRIKKKNCILILDGVDLITEEDPKAFISLVQRVKYATTGTLLKVVFVSSEGYVMPLSAYNSQVWPSAITTLNPRVKLHCMGRRKDLFLS